MTTLIRALSALGARLEHGPPRWLPFLAAVGVAAAAGAIGRVPPILDAALLVALVALTAMTPSLGHIALVAGALVSPLTIPTGTQTEVHFAILAVPVLAALWLIGALRRRDFTVFRLPAVRAACALALAAALATAVAQLPGVGFGRTASLSAQLGGLGVFVLSATLVVLAADQLRDPGALQRLTWLYLALAAVMVGSHLMPELAELGDWLLPSGSRGSLTWTWFAALATAQVACNRALNWRPRLIAGAGLAGLLAHGIGDGRTWVSGWLPPMAAIAAVIVVAVPRAGAALLLVAAAAAVWQLPRLTALVMIGDNAYSLGTRLDAWQVLAQIWAANPLLGIGPSNYYQVTPLFKIRGYNLNFSSHSTYIDLLAQTGLVGLACFAWFCWAVARTGWRLRHRVPSGFSYAYVCGALGGLVGTLAAGGLGDWVLPFVYNVTLEGLRASLPGWMFLGALIALGRGFPEPSPRPRPAAPLSVRGALAAIIAVAVLLRVATAIWLGDAAASVSGAADQVSYDALAQRLLAGHGFSFATPWYPFTDANAPTSHWSFLYTAYLAGVYAVAGHHPLVARLLQASAAGLGCWLIFRIGRRLFDTRVGLAAAAALALYAYFVFFAAALMTQTFYILALLLVIERALAIAAAPTLGAWATLGLGLGVGVLLRQTLLLYAPVLFIWLLWRPRQPRAWRGALLALGLTALCVLPWTARNYAVFGDLLLLNSNGGFFLYASNHPDQGDDFDPQFVPPLPDELRGAGEPAIDRELTRRAAGFVTADPRRFLQLSLSRIGWYFHLLPSAHSTSISNVARLSSYTLYLPFMLAGLWLSRRHWRACLPLYVYVALDAVLHLTSWSAPRYRLPSDALMMVFAGLAVVRLIDRLRGDGTSIAHSRPQTM